MSESKKCFKCGQVKSLDEFYRHPAMFDGRLNKCKECTKNDVNKHRQENIEKIRAYDRERAKNSDRIKAASAVNKAWRNADKRRSVAHSAVARAIKAGRLLRMPCSRCGDANSLAHHEDYDKPLEVVWLCQPCHKQRHKEILKDCR